MSAFRRMMSYLGLVDDDEYDEYDGYEEPHGAPPAAQARPPARPGAGEPMTEQVGTVRTLPRDTDQPSTVSMAPRVSSVVRPLTPMTSVKPQTVTPTSFQDAKDIGDRLRSGVPVIVNLQGADRDLTRRIIDFASGLTYGLEAEMEQTGPASRVYLLTPTQRS